MNMKGIDRDELDELIRKLETVQNQFPKLSKSVELTDYINRLRNMQRRMLKNI